MPVIDTNNPERIATLARAMAFELDRQSWFELLEAATGQPVP